jgi:hypothetical protein
MFVLAKTARDWQARYYASELERLELLQKWNELVTKINAKGGAPFLDGDGPAQLDGEDIKRLLMLCHPDKHGGKKMAEEMTQKLLALRRAL